MKVKIDQDEPSPYAVMLASRTGHCSVYQTGPQEESRP